VIEGSPPSGRFDSPDDAAPATRRDHAEFGAEAPVEGTEEFGAYQSSQDRSSAFPWPPPEGASVAGAFVATWQGATFQPARFFRALPERTPLGSALLYYVTLGILIAGAQLFWRIVRAPAERDTALTPPMATDAVPPIVEFLLSPVELLIRLFLLAAVAHGLLKLFGGAKRDYSTTARVFAFAYSPQVFTVLFAVFPRVGSAVGLIWMCVISIVGLRETQRTSTGTAATAVLIPVLVALIITGLVYLAQAAGNVLNIRLR
jgi:hypothetical protein